MMPRLAPGATIERVREAESCLGLKFPEQVASLWRAFDGLEVDDPPFKILSLSEMKREDGLLVFCSCDRTVRLAFDVSAKNQAGQWSIVNAGTNYCITLTIASFWSTHMWFWIIKRSPIWYDVHH
jgi:cell wall assembly regulator SMI1